VRAVGTDGTCISVQSSSLKSLDDDVDECAVCLDPMEKTTSTLRCGHKMHEACLRSLVSVAEAKGERTSCPMCRTNVGTLVDWVEMSALDSLLGYMHCAYSHRFPAHSNSRSIKFAAKRMRLLVNAAGRNEDGGLLERMVRLHATDAEKMRKAKSSGAGIRSKFAVHAIMALALALPSNQEWEVPLIKAARQIVPGSQVLEDERISSAMQNYLMTEI